MGPRYLAFVGPDTQVAALAPHAARLAERHRFECVLRAAETLVFASPQGSVAVGPAGLILGTLFRQAHGAARSRAIDTAEAARILASPDRLLRDYWGAYLAILPERGGPGAALLRAPFGELGCYYWTDGALVVAASDVLLLGEWAGQTPAIDWDALARYLISAEPRTGATCLKGIRELTGGERLTTGSGVVSVSPRWSPWEFTARMDEAQRFEDAAEAVHATASDCVGRWGREFQRVLVGISGGLDSSIVAASLARAQARFECVTFVTADPMGDERPFARAVADHLGVPLAEAFREPGGIDLTATNAAHLPRPTGRSFAQESERIGLSVAREIGADAIFRGGGGDNVFCYLQSVRPVVDRIRAQGWGPGTLESLLDICRLTGCSLATAFRRTWAQRRRAPHYRFPGDATLLSCELAARAGDTAPHPWLEPPPGTLPGQAAHVALVLAMANHMEPLAPEIAMPLLSPLMSQPLVELCLTIPSWLWCRGGNNRMVARRAFAGDLPAEVIQRRGKGTPDSFVIEVFEANRRLIGERLESGLLAGQGLLDLAAIRAALADTRPVSDHGYSRLVQLVDVEAWARSWARARATR